MLGEFVSRQRLLEPLRKHTYETRDLALENSTAIYAMKMSWSSQLELGFPSASASVTEAEELKESKMRKLVNNVCIQFRCVPSNMI